MKRGSLCHRNGSCGCPYYDKVLTRLRGNTFTAMTRSSGYLTITANGSRGKKVIEEIEDIRSGRDTVTFEVPDSKKLRQLYTDDMNKNLEERQKNEEFFKLLQEQMKSKRYLGKEEYRLFKKLEAKFSTIENDNEDNEYLF